MAVEGELENLCAGQTELISKHANVRCDQPQVLRDKRQTAQFSLYRLEDLLTRPRHPMPGLGCRCVGRYMPRRSKTTEVIQANHVHLAEQSPQAVNAPTIAGPPKGFPIINRVSPALSLRTEIVGRHACDEARSAPFIEQEKLRVGPHVARIGRNEKRQVPNQPDTHGVRILLE